MTSETPASSARPTTGQALIDEIPPAMRRKLRFDSRVLSGVCGAMFLGSGLHALNQQGSHETWFHGLGIVGVVMGIGFYAAAIFAPGLGERGELKYRRQHGKWRWER